MSTRNERVAAMVRAELAKDGQIGNADLLKKARAIDPKLRRLTSRQFHGTYRLPALREAKRALRASGKAPAPAPAKAAAGGKSTNGTQRGRPRNVPASQGTASASEIMDAAPREATVRSKIAREVTAPRSTEASASAAPAPSRAAARPRAADREAVREVLQSVAREALAVEDRASFIRLLDSLDQRAEMILNVAGRG